LSFSFACSVRRLCNVSWVVFVSFSNAVYFSCRDWRSFWDEDEDSCAAVSCD
jgi:hypothetical protein